MKKISKYNRKRDIIPQKEGKGPVSKLPAMTERAFSIYTNTPLLPVLANLIAEYASPSHRETVEYFCSKAETTVGDITAMRNKVKCDKGKVDFIKHKGRKPGKREFYVNPKIEFYVFDHIGSGGRTFFITKEYFITSLETKLWFLPDNTKIKISPELYTAILNWLNEILPSQ